MLRPASAAAAGGGGLAGTLAVFRSIRCHAAALHSPCSKHSLSSSVTALDPPPGAGTTRCYAVAVLVNFCGTVLIFPGLVTRALSLRGGAGPAAAGGDSSASAGQLLASDAAAYGGSAAAGGGGGDGTTHDSGSWEEVLAGPAL